jgi:hypothetical protein
MGLQVLCTDLNDYQIVWFSCNFFYLVRQRLDCGTGTAKHLPICLPLLEFPALIFHIAVANQKGH